MRGGVRVYFAATLCLGVVAFLGIRPWFMTSLPILVALFSMGFILPNSVVGALQRHANHAGSASALMGTLQFCLGAVSGLAVGVLADGTSRPMAVLMMLGGLGALVAEALRPAAPHTQPHAATPSPAPAASAPQEPARIRAA